MILQPSLSWKTKNRNFLMRAFEDAKAEGGQFEAEKKETKTDLALQLMTLFPLKMH